MLCSAVQFRAVLCYLVTWLKFGWSITGGERSKAHNLSTNLVAITVIAVCVCARSRLMIKDTWPKTCLEWTHIVRQGVLTVKQNHNSYSWACVHALLSHTGLVPESNIVQMLALRRFDLKSQPLSLHFSRHTFSDPLRPSPALSVRKILSIWQDRDGLNSSFGRGSRQALTTVWEMKRTGWLKHHETSWNIIKRSKIGNARSWHETWSQSWA